MTATFTDQAVRDRVTDDLHSTLFVEAGAGTGKTTALVTRDRRLVGSGAARFAQLAAITFTEAAAAELRDRIGAALEQGAVDPSVAPEVRTRLAVALDEVDQTTISTLHGFAQRILSAHPVEAGLPRGCEVPDEIRAGRGVRGALAALPRRAARRPPSARPSSSRPASAASGSTRSTSWRAASTTTGTSWSTTSPATARTPRSEPGSTLRDLPPTPSPPRPVAPHEVDRAQRHLHVPPPVPRRAHQRRPIGLPLLGLLREAPQVPATPTWQQGPLAGCDDVRDLLRADRASARGSARGLRLDALATPVVALRDPTLEAADRRRRGPGALDSTTCSCWPATCSAHHPCRAPSCGGRCRHLLIDEFQDTDPIQAELAVLLALAPDPTRADRRWDGRWRRRPGRLFFVGDPKQSIYRFRRADIARVPARSGASAPRSRRPHPELPLVPGSSPPSTRCSRPCSVRATAPCNLRSRRWRRTVPPDPRASGCGPARRPPRCSHGGHARGGRGRHRPPHPAGRGERWPVGDTGEALPPATSPCWSHHHRAARAPACLRRRRHRLPAGDLSLVFATPEVAISCRAHRGRPPERRAHGRGGAAGPALGCGDAVPRRARRGRRSLGLPPERPGPDGARRRPGVTARLLAAALLAHRERQVDAGRCATADCPTSVAPPRRPLRHWRRLRFLVDQARAFVESGGTDLRGWLAWTDVLADDGAKVREVALPQSDDVVRKLLTAHGSKGPRSPW